MVNRTRVSGVAGKLERLNVWQNSEKTRHWLFLFLKVPPEEENSWRMLEAAERNLGSRPGTTGD